MFWILFFYLYSQTTTTTTTTTTINVYLVNDAIIVTRIQALVAAKTHEGKAMAETSG